MKQYVQADPEADRQVVNSLAELIIGGSLVSVPIGDQERETGGPMPPDQDPVYRTHAEGPFHDRKGPLTCNFVAGAGFEPATSGL